MKLKITLNKIASIQVGYSFRERLGFLGKGGIAVIQMKDLTDENLVDFRNLMRVNIQDLKEHHLVKPGDLIFRSRGRTSTSAILVDDPGPAVVAAPLLRIRPRESIILPEYLNWYLNQASAQTFFASVAKGTSQRMISKHALDNLQVCVPSLERQRAIAELVALAGKEQELMKKVAERRRQYVFRRLHRLTEGE